MELDRSTHTLHVDDHGPAGAERTLVLIHGGGDSSGTWSALVPAFREIGRVVTYDLVGHGRSTIPAEFRKRMHDDDVDAVVAWTGDPHPVLVGHSLGSAVAMWAAHRGDFEPAGVLLIDGAPTRVHFDGYARRDPGVERERLASMGYEEPHLSFFVQMATNDHDAIVEWTDPDVWLQPTVPTIVLAAERGPSGDVRHLIDERCRAQPNVHLDFRWVDTGHGLHEERPDVVVDALRDLLDRI